MKNPVPHIIHHFLQKQGIRISDLRIREIYYKHPLSHSIRALSDTLDGLHVENMVCKLSFEQLFEIEGAFIVVAGKDDYPFHIVERLDQESGNITLYTATKRRVTLSFDQFREVWDGTVLMAEKGEQTEEDGWVTYWIKQELWFIDRTSKFWIVALVVYFLIWGVMHNPMLSDLRYLVKLGGVLVSLLVVAKASVDPHLAQRFCHNGKRADCNDVLQSAGAKVLGWVSLGELSLTYFSTSIVWGIFIAEIPAAVFPWLNALAMLFVLYSFAWQIHHKQWCSPCLLIDLVLIVDFITEMAFWNNMHTMTNLEFYTDLLNFGLLFVLCLLAVRIIVSMAEQNRIIPQLKYKLERFLSSSEAFWMLLQRQPEEPVDSNNIPAVCNFIEAEHTITVVMNPSCPKCAKVHDAIGALEGYRINLVFIVNEGDEKSHEAALAIISSGIKKDWSVTDRVIKNWYAKRELPEFLEPHYRAEEDLKAQIEYCRKIHIEGTPTILVDNRKLPEMYDVEDLKILL